MAQRAQAQRPVQDRLFEQYQRQSAQLTSHANLAAVPIGAAALPIASVEVTRKTLKALAAQDDVVAVLPDQRIRLIRPKSADYDTLAAAEVKNGMTWA